MCRSLVVVPVELEDYATARDFPISNDRAAGHPAFGAAFAAREAPAEPRHPHRGGHTDPPPRAARAAPTTAARSPKARPAVAIRALKRQSLQGLYWELVADADRLE
jgi:hypothetical protein